MAAVVSVLSWSFSWRVVAVVTSGAVSPAGIRVLVDQAPVGQVVPAAPVATLPPAMP